MNDFSEVEKRLRELRPVRASAELFSQIERRLGELDESDLVSERVIRPNRFRLNWLSLGVALGAAAGLLIIARVNLKPPAKKIPAAASLAPTLPASKVPAPSRFIPAGATQVVYNQRDEGLFFPTGSAQPVRRLRSNMRETLQWRNPATGATLRVSYPSEQVELIPVSGI
jgi:hypothetical protein